jgi:hypothetical protein
MEIPKKLKMTFQIQKNRQNGQSGGRQRPSRHMSSPSRSSHFSESQKLDQLDSEPMGVFINKFGIKKYLMGGKIAQVLQSIAKIVHPNLSAEELSRISLHLGRVWALVLFDKAGMSPAFMTSQQRWTGDPYKVYLQDTSILQHKHVDALKMESNEVVKPLGSNKDVLPNIVPVDDDTEDY